VHDRNLREARDVAEIGRLKSYAYRTMKYFSHCKNKEAIRGYVEERFDVTGPSILEIPLAVDQLIWRDISHFTGFSVHR
jgi:hypothetical protein